MPRGRTTALGATLRAEYRCAWLRAACELVFCARDHTRALRLGRNSVLTHEALDRAASELYEVESEWRPLVRSPECLKFRQWGDGEENAIRRLCHHATRFVPWFYRPRYGAIELPHETWRRIAMLRAKAFHDAARQLDMDDA
jgi:hypothetical protein